MQFRVPQFIDIEDKILGPLGWKQLAYVLAGIGLTYLIFKASSSKVIATILSIPIISLFGSLAFVKINNKDFLDVMEDASKYFFSNKIYTWQQDKNISNLSSDISMSPHNTSEKIQIINTNKASKLGDKAFNVDVK